MYANLAVFTKCKNLIRRLQLWIPTGCTSSLFSYWITTRITNVTNPVYIITTLNEPPIRNILPTTNPPASTDYQALIDHLWLMRRKYASWTADSYKYHGLPYCDHGLENIMTPYEISITKHVQDDPSFTKSALTCL
jgi:hypothetical protein